VIQPCVETYSPFFFDRRMIVVSGEALVPALGC
jgi:hypothetical protein